MADPDLPPLASMHDLSLVDVSDEQSQLLAELDVDILAVPSTAGTFRGLSWHDVESIRYIDGAYAFYKRVMALGTNIVGGKDVSNLVVNILQGELGLRNKQLIDCQ